MQILPMLKELFTEDSEVEHLIGGASSNSEPNLFFGVNALSLGLMRLLTEL